jgi:hypothetical protein
MLGAILGSAWLNHACPPAACSGILMLMQLPELAIVGIIWLASGLVGIPILLSIKPRPHEKAAEPGKCCDGRHIRLGDSVRIGKTKHALGTVVFVYGAAPDPHDPDSARLSALQVGFAVRTAQNDLHHFLVANPYVVLVSPVEPQRASAA